MKKSVLICCLFFGLVLGHAQEANTRQIITEPKIKLFPNPATNVINVLGLQNSEKANIIISDMYGNTVLEHRWKIKNNAINIPIAQLSPGIYLIAISSREQKVQAKFYKR